jgi:hypothetical protein
MMDSSYRSFLTGWKPLFLAPVVALACSSTRAGTATGADAGESFTSTVLITTDRAAYSSGETVKTTVANQGDKSTYVWLGPCGLFLQSSDGSMWTDASVQWSGCYPCAQREMPDPVFLAPGASQTLSWDQVVVSCERQTPKPHSC